ncbi:sensor histidine kinase [Paenibacillus sp. CC-CFT747]|nr:sensor histidine kinase [Paenibacillus sp. CC-CFT747]
MTEKTKWQWLDWALYGVLASWYGLAFIKTILDPELAERASWPVTGSLMLLCYLPFVFWRPGYIRRRWFLLALLLTSGPAELYLSLQTGKAAGILTLPCLVIGFFSRGRSPWWTAPVFVLGIPLADWLLVGDYPYVGDMIGQTLNHGLLYGIGYAIQRIWRTHLRTKRLYEENLRQYELIREQNAALAQYAGQVEKLTLLEERNRLARELHDTVGHTFTSVIMGMDAVSYLLASAPDKAAAKLEVLRNVTRRGLEEVRKSIHQIAPPEEGTLYEQLEKLAREFSAHTGTRIRIETVGVETDLPQTAVLTMVRCLQESLTNAKRHGEASSVEIVLAYQPAQLQLYVVDNGTGTGELVAGFGLGAMKERLASLNGSLDIRSQPDGGTTVVCTVPVRPAAAGAGSGG